MDFEIQTDHVIPVGRPDLVRINKTKKNSTNTLGKGMNPNILPPAMGK